MPGDEQYDAKECFEKENAYRTGEGVEQSDTEVDKWFNQYVEYYFGEMYENGKGVEQSYEEAVKWYKSNKYVAQDIDIIECGIDAKNVEKNKSEAQKGDRFAQYILGVMYENGKGVKQSYVEAVKWYRMAAEQGDVYTQLKLGQMYENGKGVE